METYMSLAPNVVNPNKKNKIIGNVFHLFYPDESTSILYDSLFVEPIIWGSKNVVMTHLKNIDDISDLLTPDSKVIVYSYVMTSDGYKRRQTYNGLVSGIGKYILRV